MGRRYKGGKALATRKSQRSITAPNYHCPNEKLSWTNNEKRALLAGLYKHSTEDIDSIAPVIPTRSREEIAWLIQKYKLKAAQKKKSKSESPIEIWLEMVSDLVSHEEEDYSELIGDVMSIVSRWDCPDRTEDPDYRRIYKYMEAMFANVPVPPLQPVEAAILLELLYGLADMLRSSELVMLHELMQWKYELLSRPVIPAKLKDVHEDVRMALENEWPRFEEYGIAVPGSQTKRKDNQASDHSDRVVVVKVPSFQEKQASKSSKTSVHPSTSQAVNETVTTASSVPVTHTTSPSAPSCSGQENPQTKTSERSEQIVASSLKQANVPVKPSDIHVEIVREYLTNPGAALGSEGTQTIDLCDSSDSDTPLGPALPRPCYLVRKKKSREFPLMMRSRAVKISAEQAKRIQAAKLLKPKRSVDKSRAKSRSAQLSTACAMRMQAEQERQQGTGKKSRKRKVAELGKTEIECKIESTTTSDKSKKYAVYVIESQKAADHAKSRKLMLSNPGKPTVGNRSKAANKSVVPVEVNLQADLEELSPNRMAKEIPDVPCPSQEIKTEQGNSRPEKHFIKPKLFTLNPLCVPVRLLKLHPKLRR